MTMLAAAIADATHTDNNRRLLESAVTMLRGEGTHLAYGTTPEDAVKAQAIVDAFYDLAEALEDELPTEFVIEVAKASLATFRQFLPRNDSLKNAALDLIERATH